MPANQSPYLQRIPRPQTEWIVTVVGGFAVAVLGNVSISPFGTAFRFSLGPITLALLVLFFRNLSPVAVGFTGGLWIVGIQSAVAALHAPAGAIGPVVRDAVATYGPELLAYTGLGLIWRLARVQDEGTGAYQIASVLALGDFTVNIVEQLIRHMSLSPHTVTITAMIAVGRAVFSTGLVVVAQAGARERRWSEERKAYMHKLIFLSNLQTDIFFLRKSSSEIEQIMERAHRLYRDLRGLPAQRSALEIAKDIHEVKKDYQRIMASLSRLLEIPDVQPTMRFSEIVAMVLETNAVYAETLGKAITFESDLQADFLTYRFGRWISILNNLVTNGVEACGTQGRITISSRRIGHLFRLEVSDNGSGIPEKDQAHIFSAGFSTKLNPITRSFSSGLGLTHVRGLVQAMQGEIRLRYSGPGGTTFCIEVPWDGLEALPEED